MQLVVLVDDDTFIVSMQLHQEAMEDQANIM